MWIFSLLIYLIIVHTIISMKVEFDPAKNAKNIRERGISFALATDFEIDTALIKEDCSYDYDD